MNHKQLQILTLLLLIFGMLCVESCRKDEETETVDPYEESYVGPGSSAKEYLRSDKYTSLVLDIIYEPGVAPNQGAINELDSFLRTYLNKPKGIHIVQREIEDQKENSLRTKELQDIEQKYRSRLNSKDTLATYIYFANSKFSEDTKNTKLLGLAYAPTSMVIFQKTISENAAGNKEVIRKLEESILKHEFGHLLGLVDIGTPPVNSHKDSDHPDHCDNRDCLMYYGVQTAATSNNIPLVLDENCKLDLRSNGGKP
jgi:predicted Zn-dependent protease